MPATAADGLERHGKPRGRTNCGLPLSFLSVKRHDRLNNRSEIRRSLCTPSKRTGPRWYFPCSTGVRDSSSFRDDEDDSQFIGDFTGRELVYASWCIRSNRCAWFLHVHVCELHHKRITPKVLLMRKNVT
jgi:hypothetical protein